MNVDGTLAMIDGALDDHISSDAMRWQPPDDYDEPVVLPPARLGGTRILTDRLGWDGYAATAALAPYGPASHADLDALAAACRTAVAEAFRPLARALAQIAADLRAGLHAELERRQRGLPPEHPLRVHYEELSEVVKAGQVKAAQAHHEQQGGHPFAVRPERARRR